MKYLTVYAKETYEAIDEGVGMIPCREITGSLNLSEKLYKQFTCNDDYDEAKKNAINSNEFKNIINRIKELTEFYQDKNITNNIDDISINDSTIIIKSYIQGFVFTDISSTISELEIILKISNKKIKENLIDSGWL